MPVLLGWGFFVAAVPTSREIPAHLFFSLAGPGQRRSGPVHRRFPRPSEMPTHGGLRRRVESGFFPFQWQNNAFAGKILVAVSGVKGLG
jgi:hypothetical protein